MVWQEGNSQPCHIEGPFPVSSCEKILDVTAHGLQRSQHYTASIVAYNDDISLKSKKIDLCKYMCIDTVHISPGLPYLHINYQLPQT